MVNETSTPSPAEAEIAAIIAQLNDGTPAGTIFVTLSEFSLVMPQSLANITSAIGLRALELIDNPTQSFSWEDFLNLQLTDEHQQGVARITVISHDEAGGGSTDPEVIARIMPGVFDLARKSLVGSIVELARGEDGNILEDITPKSPVPDYDAARTYLFGDNGTEHRAALRALLSSNVTVLAEQDSLAQNYRNSLRGIPSSKFPDAKREGGNTLRSKKILTEHLRPLLLPSAITEGTSHGLTRHQIGTFVSNVTRP